MAASPSAVLNTPWYLIWELIGVDMVLQHCLPALPCLINNAYDTVGDPAVAHSIGTSGYVSFSLLTRATALRF